MRLRLSWRRKCICPTEAELDNPRVMVLAGNCPRHGMYSYGPDYFRQRRDPVGSYLSDEIADIERQLHA